MSAPAITWDEDDGITLELDTCRHPLTTNQALRLSDDLRTIVKIAQPTPTAWVIKGPTRTTLTSTPGTVESWLWQSNDGNHFITISNPLIDETMAFPANHHGHATDMCDLATTKAGQHRQCMEEIGFTIIDRKVTL